MTRDELRAHANKPVCFRDCTLILRGIKSVPDGKGGTRTVVLLQDTKVKNSYVIARAQDIQAIECP